MCVCVCVCEELRGAAVQGAVFEQGKADALNITQ